ncbi:MAG TPA: DUF2752 domain-containing protein [Chthoniobacterales bacterium]|nr:DUF2752 domain-containing protein [Chthoniobacterales bacterium]
MRLYRRPLATGELDHELLWLSVSVASLGLAATWLSLGLPWPQCAFHAITGHPCATCGMTRSAIQFFHGHFFAAMRWNPLVFGVLCVLSTFDAYAFVVLIARAPRLRIGALTAAEKNFVRASIVTLLIVNWIYLLLHWRNF